MFQALSLPSTSQVCSISIASARIMSPRTSCACSQGTKPPPSPPPPDQRRSLPVSRDGPGSSPSLQRAYAACLLELPPTEALCDGPMMCAGTSPGCGVPPFTPSAAGHKEHPWEAPGGCRFDHRRRFQRPKDKTAAACRLRRGSRAGHESSNRKLKSGRCFFCSLLFSFPHTFIRRSGEVCVGTYGLQQGRAHNPAA